MRKYKKNEEWIKNRLNDCEAVENEDFEAFSKNLENGGRTKEYILKLDTAKEMAMLERNEKGKQVRRYFINVEKKYKEQVKPKTALEMLQLQSQAIFEVNEKVDIVKQELDDFKQDMPLLAVECDKITTAVHKRGVAALGGKKVTPIKIPLCVAKYTKTYIENSKGSLVYLHTKQSNVVSAILPFQS